MCRSQGDLVPSSYQQCEQSLLSSGGWEDCTSCGVTAPVGVKTRAPRWYTLPSSCEFYCQTWGNMDTYFYLPNSCAYTDPKTKTETTGWSSCQMHTLSSALNDRHPPLQDLEARGHRGILLLSLLPSDYMNLTNSPNSLKTLLPSQKEEIWRNLLHILHTHTHAHTQRKERKKTEEWLFAESLTATATNEP